MFRRFLIRFIFVYFAFSSIALAAGDNHVALFVGNTQSDGYTLATVGVDYERKLNDQFGVGVFAESLSDSSHSAVIVGIPFFYHPTFLEHSKLIAAVAVEELTVAEKTKQKSLVRVGGGYDFYIQAISISPTLFLDFVGGKTATVYGVAIGAGF